MRRLEEADHQLLRRIVGLQGTIIENQSTVLAKIPGLKVTLAGPPPVPPATE